MRKCITIAALLLITVQAGAQDFLKYVNTLQGTYSTGELSYGSTYPTVGLPFAEQWYSAQTGKNGFGWKYQYQVNTIRGFQQVHQCSAWMNDYAVFSLMPLLLAYLWAKLGGCRWISSRRLTGVASWTG